MLNTGFIHKVCCYVNSVQCSVDNFGFQHRYKMLIDAETQDYNFAECGEIGHSLTLNPINLFSASQCLHRSDQFRIIFKYDSNNYI